MRKIDETGPLWLVMIGAVLAVLFLVLSVLMPYRAVELGFCAIMVFLLLIIGFLGYAIWSITVSKKG